MNIKLRLETKEDHPKVEKVTREAFWNQYVPGCDEHYLVNILRDHKDFIPELNFVAELVGEVVGNIMYTRSWVENEKGDKVETVTFGPVCVHPEHQKKGIGSKLIKHTLKLAEEMGFSACCIFGDPRNYCKHGFKNGLDHNVSAMGGIYPYGFLVKVLKTGVLEGQNWEYGMSDVYHFDKADAEEFDSSFEPKVKEYKPSQDIFSISIRATLKK